MRLFSIRAVVLASAVLLAACGGGGDGAGTASTTTTSSSQPVAAAITVQGSSTKVTADPLALIYMGPNGSSSTLFGANTLGSTSSAAASSQTQLDGGGFSAFNIGAVAVSLTQGTITDLAGTSDFQIGRWTNGKGQNVPTMNANQGAYYVAGKPIQLQASQTAGTFACTLAAATKPTAVSGATAPGTVTSATATIDKTTLNATINITYSIGADQSVAINKTVAAGSASSGNGIAMVTSVIGSNATQPNLAVVFTAKSSASGDTSGSVVLSCQ
ncbi:hypothetical protein [Ralstonia sp. ASV6]|uniref:hypothetical protein n=1 Tax=Ralstonia sp. ASV6 TaxID=2795124 RepID=UPI0018ED93F2|nr:hypothetical protein [Ralstonia sp. ASV6]